MKRSSNFFDNLTGLSLAKMNAFLNPPQQLPTVDLLEDKIEPLIVFKELDQLDYIRMALTMMESLNLLEDPGASMPGDLVNNFNRVLQICIEGCASLH